MNIPGMTKPETLLELGGFILALWPMLEKLKNKKLPDLADAQKAGQAAQRVADVFKNFDEEFAKTFKDEFAVIEGEKILLARDPQLVDDFDRFYTNLSEADSELLRRLLFTAYKLKQEEGVADVMQAIASKVTDADMTAKFDGMKLKVAQNQQLSASEVAEKLGQVLRYAWDSGVLPVGKFAGEFLVARGKDVDQTLGSISAALTAERVSGDPSSSLMEWAKGFAKGK